jgi:hypothetical protein
MSIASEVTRLQNAKANLKTAIKSKGVEVDDTDTIDTFASKVDEIQMGGSDSWYDTFWDSFQQNGKRTDYKNFAFGGISWNDQIFKPKYDIRPTVSADMFKNSKITDLKHILINCGVVLDCSTIIYSAQTMFADSNVTRLPLLDFSATENMRSMFSGCTDLNYIEKLILISKNKMNTNTFDVNLFRGCTSLQHIVVEGVISNANVNLQSSPITAECAKSFINCLENYAATENEFKYTITFSATTWGYLDAEGETASPNGNTWREYINDLGWNAS